VDLGTLLEEQHRVCIELDDGDSRTSFERKSEGEVVRGDAEPAHSVVEVDGFDGEDGG